MINSLLELLDIDGSVSIQMRNLQILATEINKLINNLSPPIMNRVFKPNIDTHYNNLGQFSRSHVTLVYHRMESISYLGPKICNTLPDDYKP